MTSRILPAVALAGIGLATTLPGCHSSGGERPVSSSVDASLAGTAEARSASLRRSFEASRVPTAVAVVATRDGRTEFVEMGTLDPDDPRPVTADSIFDIASMTKAITTVAALQMVEAGRIGLDDPLEPVLPELREIEIIAEDGSRSVATRAITLRDLLRHTAGFGYAFNSPQIAAELEFDPETGWPVHEVAAEGEFDWGFEVRPRRVFESGTDWLYGRNIGIAGKLVERLSGRDLDTYFEENIFEPLGMDRSGFNPSAALLEDRVRMHVRDPADGEPNPASPFRADRLESFYGGGYLYSTPRDYARFLRCLLAGGELDGVRILEPATIEEMMTDQLPEGIRVVMDPPPGDPVPRRSFTNDFDDGFGLGWAIETGAADGLRPRGVGYWSGAHNTYFTIDPDRGVAIIFFSQMQPFDDVEAYELYRSWEDGVYRAILPTSD